MDATNPHGISRQKAQKLREKNWPLRARLFARLRAATVVYVLVHSPEAADKQQISELNVFPTHVIHDFRIFGTFSVLDILSLVRI